MHCTGKHQARVVIDGLLTEGSTNLIDANELALGMALADTTSKNIHIVILTDGEPNNPEGVLPHFLKAMEPLEHARVAGHHHGVCVSTFGFGYAMDSVRCPAREVSLQPFMFNA